MKVIRIDTPHGEYHTITEKEMNELFTQEQINDFKTNNETTFMETKYTTRQLQRARRLHYDQEYCYDFEDEHGIAPSVYDILEHLYN